VRLIGKTITMESIGDYLNKLKDRKGETQKVHSAHQQLAIDVAKGFDDMDHIGIYMKICKVFPDYFVRKKVTLVKEMNPRNPGRYFTSIMFKEMAVDK